MDLTGLEFLWTLITDCAREDIADLAIDYFLQVAFIFFCLLWIQAKNFFDLMQ
jgi:hypothetical protein